jgi:hypothetical protein
LAEQRAHHQEWFTSITPLTETAIAPADIPRLRSEFFSGIAARYEHILAGVDIPRPHHTEHIHSQWQKTSVLIIRAASGQGKTTLALRYIHDFYPGQWRFKIELIHDRPQAVRVARALSGFASAVQSPILIYIDVSPRDVDWPELVQHLSSLTFLRVLVTIREEDYQRAELSGASFFFEDVSLTFDRHEAEKFFLRASSEVQTKKFIDFDEAWTAFGTGGPLLEFVYLLTQTGTLRDRLATQVKRIRLEVSQGERHASELRVLQIVAVATTYEARVDVLELQKSVSHPDLSTCLSGLEKEYLVRRSLDGRFLEGLHPVRSSLLEGLLCDPVLSPWIQVATQCFSVIPEADTQGFIFRALLDRSGCEISLLGAARNKHWSTWTGFAAILRAHIWFFLRLQSTSSGSPMEADTFRQQITSWLDQSRPRLPTAPETDEDWSGISWTWHFLSTLQVKPGLYLRVSEKSMGIAVRNLPLKRLAQIALSMFLASPQDYKAWWVRQRAIITLRLAEDYGILCLDRKDGVTYIHYLFDAGTRRGKDSLDHHAATMERIWLIRSLLPDHEKYGTRAYGHSMGDALPLPFDDTQKNGIPVNSLPPPLNIQVIRIRRNLQHFSARLDSWSEFANSIASLHSSIASSAQILTRWVRQALERHHTQDYPSMDISSKQALEECCTLLDRPLRLPKQAVDPLGFGSEEDGEGVSELIIFTGRAVLMQRYLPFFSSYRKFNHDLGTFLFHARAITSAKTHADSRDERSLHLSVSTLHNARLSLITFREQFRGIFGHLIEAGRLASLEDAVHTGLETLWPLWFHFGNGPTFGSGSDVESGANTLIASAKRTLTEQIDRACESIASSDAQARVHATNGLGSNITLWIQLDMVDFRSVDRCGEALVDALHSEISAGSGDVLARYTAEEVIRTLYIIPTFRGKAVDHSAWQFHTVATFFSPLNRDEPTKWWKWIRRAMDKHPWERLGLACWETAELKMLHTIQESVSLMWQERTRLKSLESVPELTEAGKTLADSAVRAGSVLMKTFRTAAVESMDQVVDFWDSLPGRVREAHALWAEVVSYLPELYSMLFSGDETRFEEDEDLGSDIYAAQILNAAQVSKLIVNWWVSGLDESDV